jgi:hypothetical protein
MKYYEMMRYRRTFAPIAASTIVLAATLAAQQQPPVKPSSPSVPAAPAWSRVLNMPDGRTFVTDGGLSIDVKFAKPATLPSVVLAPESAKMLAGRLTEPHDKEIALGEDASRTRS